MLKHYGIVVRYNLMKHMAFIEVPNINGEGNTENAGYGIIVSLCKLNDLDCVSLIDNYLHVISNREKYHPVKEWIEDGDEKWDGVDRFKEFCNLIILNDFDETLAHMYFRKWLLGCYAALYKEDFRSRIVLVFQGVESSGKTTLMKSLMKSGESSKWYHEGFSLDPHNKDSVMKGISHWISELGELDGIFKRAEMSALKAFISSQNDVLRVAYDKREETYQRRSMFLATVNDPIVLTDQGEGTRFLIVSVSKILLDKAKLFNAKQFWLQVRTWYDKGEDWWLDDKERELLIESNKKFKETDPYQDSIETNYKISELSFEDDLLRHLKVAQIAEELGYKNPTKQVANGLARALRRMGFKWKHTMYGDGFLMPKLYTDYEKDSMQVAHVFEGKVHEDRPV